MTAPRLPFLDWMKSVGMLLIVYGHSQGSTNYLPTPPFYCKQLGVVFFVFATGFSLALSQRSTRREIYNRLFEPLVMGLAIAMVYSVLCFGVHGNLAESNYMPFVLGSNIILNDFPANSTTWYIGTYVHILLLWAVFVRGRTIRVWMIPVSLICETVIRALILNSGYHYVAYMLFTNWTTVFLLGTLAAQQSQRSGAVPSLKPSLAIGLVGLTLLAGVWPRLATSLTIDQQFPLQHITIGSEALNWFATSIGVSVLYSAYAWSFYHLARCLPRWRSVEFISRNTLFVFYTHMPLIKLLTPGLYVAVRPGWLRVLCNLLIFLVGLAAASEIINRLVPFKRWRESLASLVDRGRGAKKLSLEPNSPR